MNLNLNSLFNNSIFKGIKTCHSKKICPQRWVRNPLKNQIIKINKIIFNLVNLLLSLTSLAGLKWRLFEQVAVETTDQIPFKIFCASWA